jgi:cytochrome P450
MANGAQAGCPVDLTAYDWPGLGMVECPFPYYETLRTEAPVYRYPGRNQYVVSRWVDIVRVAEHPEIFIQDPRVVDETGEPLSAITMAGTNAPQHRRKRAIGAKFVAVDRLRRYEPVIRAIADDLIDSALARGEMEFYREFANRLPVRLVAEVLGLPAQDSPMYVGWYEDAAPGAVNFLPEEQLRKQNELRQEALAYMRAAVRHRYENPRDDFLSEMIRLQIEQEGEPALEYITQEADLMLFAGNVTTTHMLASMMLTMLRHPVEHRRLVDDHSLIKTLVEETLRLESPVQWLERLAVTDTEIDGVPIPAGSKVAMIWASGNRDVEKWDEDADCLNLDRPGVVKHNLAFGRGIHHCLGAPLARLEGRLAFEQILSRTTNLRLDPEKNDFTHLQNILFRAPKAVHIKLDAA